MVKICSVYIARSAFLTTVTAQLEVSNLIEGTWEGEMVLRMVWRWPLPWSIAQFQALPTVPVTRAINPHIALSTMLLTIRTACRAYSVTFRSRPAAWSHGIEKVDARSVCNSSPPLHYMPYVPTVPLLPACSDVPLWRGFVPLSFLVRYYQYLGRYYVCYYRRYHVVQRLDVAVDLLYLSFRNGLESLRL